MRKQFQKLNIQLVIRSTSYNRFPGQNAAEDKLKIF